MAQLTILDNEYATLWYHEESKIVHHKFHKFIYGDKFRDILEKGLESFEKYGAQKWLSDDRNNSALPKDDGGWALTQWGPRVMGLHWRYWAVVLPDKVLGQSNLNWFMTEYIQQGLVVKAFEDADEALKWLESVE